MSGSPILQNGKLVGAVTHVLLSDATKGYGISMETMLKFLVVVENHGDKKEQVELELVHFVHHCLQVVV